MKLRLFQSASSLLTKSAACGLALLTKFVAAQSDNDGADASNVTNNILLFGGLGIVGVIVVCCICKNSGRTGNAGPNNDEESNRIDARSLIRAADERAGLAP